MVLQFSHRPPLSPRLPIRATVGQGSAELWGELEPRNGAWSDPPKIPFYSTSINRDHFFVEHGGDEISDPCSANTMRTEEFPGSCVKEEEETCNIRTRIDSVSGAENCRPAVRQNIRGFTAHELSTDPDLNLLSSNASTAVFVGERYGEQATWPTMLKPSGRTHDGGFLQPFAGALTWFGSNLPASSVLAYQYRSLCARPDNEDELSNGETFLDGTAVRFRSCATEEESKDEDVTDNGKLQRFKWGYDWKGEYVMSQDVWTSKLPEDQTNIPAIHELRLSIVLAYKPYFCLDACKLSESCDGVDGYVEGSSGVVVNPCDDERQTQLFKFNASTNEIISTAPGELRDLCFGWSTSSLAVGTPLRLQRCSGGHEYDVSFQFDKRFYLETSETVPTHGAFYFDPFRNALKRGVVQPQNVHDLVDMDETYKSISSDPAGKSYFDYTVWNTSVLSVVVAGNSTLTIRTDSCPPEGCDRLIPEDDSTAIFKWSDNETWARLNYSFPCDHEPMLSHPNKMCSHNAPCGCGDVTIWDGWVVTLDMTTPFLNTLTIRGTLIVPHDFKENLAIHANLIDIKGGHLIVGNETHPFTGPLFQLVLHGDMYFHGKECTEAYDSEVSEHGCWKQMIVSGELSLHGKPVPVITLKLARDAWEGQQVVVLDGSVSEGWNVGSDVIISSSDAGGVPEYHVIAALEVANGRTVLTLSEPLKGSKIGKTVIVEDPAKGVHEVLDGRATVSLLSRNIEVRGGYNLDYDYISGVGPDLTDYGATIRLWEAYEEVRDGWDESMVGFELFGKFKYPDGRISNLKYVRFRAAGKTWDLEPPFREPPLVLLNQGSLHLEGIVNTEPLTGNFFECTKIYNKYKGSAPLCSIDSVALTVEKSIFVGVTLQFSPGRGTTHTVRNNTFFGGFECRTDCPTVKMVIFGGQPYRKGPQGGKLSVIGNTANGGFGGFTLRASCAQYDGWSGNVAVGNAVGFDVAAGCTNLRLEGYRNSAGITAATNSISNFLMVENGLAVTPGKWITWPTVKFNLPPDVLGGGSPLGHISNGTIVGRAPDDGSGSVRSSNCEVWTGGGNAWHDGFKLGGTMTGFRFWREYGYSGFAANGAYTIGGGTGYNDLKIRKIATDSFSRLGYYGEEFGGSRIAAFHYLLDGLTFFGFSGTDSCGRRNVAISNEMAGDGEGTARAFGGHFGKATCYPIEVRQTTFSETPDYARIRFSDGPTTAEVQFGLCTLFDPDGSVLGDSKFLDSGVGPYFLKSSKKHEWPAEVLRECTSWAELGYPDDFTGSGTCLWWLRSYDNLRPTILDASKRGLIEKGVRGTQYSGGFCEEIFTADAEVDNNAMLCTGMEYVILHTYVPEKIVSGSEVLYGPVGYINMYEAFYGSSYYAQEDTVVDIYRDYADNRADHVPPQTATEPMGTFSPIDPRYTQPYLATLVNRGFYRIQYTGDITLFSDGFLEYRLVSLTDEVMQPTSSESDDTDQHFALVVDIKFLKAVNLAFYYDGRQVRASPRRNRVDIDAPAGTNYHDPVSKILSFVVKGTMTPVRIRQLDVVSVAFGVVASFDEFFEDNMIDPNAIDNAFSDMVPPTYAANYDPDNGNIIKSNTFVRNVASVLNINPERIRVVNIVPGNRRRLVELAAKDPAKWKHVLRASDQRRRLSGGDDDGLGVDFEISSVDPCATVVCVHGDCNMEGLCDCQAGYEGPICNTTFINCSLPASNCPAPTPTPSLPPSQFPTLSPSLEPTAIPTATAAPTSLPSLSVPPTGTVRPTAEPSLPPTAKPSLAPSWNPSLSPSLAPTTTPTSPQSVFNELLAVGEALTAAASGGTLDTGYEISEAIIALPDDVCGVPGGDGSTCLDACGVTNGDNSTCADGCGKPYGDGTSCLNANGGSGGAGFFDCEASVETATGIANERQALRLRSAGGASSPPLSGTFALSFNGETTSALSVFTTAVEVSEALSSLNTVGTVAVSLNATAGKYK